MEMYEAYNWFRVESLSERCWAIVREVAHSLNRKLRTSIWHVYSLRKIVLRSNRRRSLRWGRLPEPNTEFSETR